MKYKVVIQADDLDELIFRIQETAIALQKDDAFCDKIKNKGINSVFFTKWANIQVEGDE